MSDVKLLKSKMRMNRFSKMLYIYIGYSRKRFVLLDCNDLSLVELLFICQYDADIQK